LALSGPRAFCWRRGFRGQFLHCSSPGSRRDKSESLFAPWSSTNCSLSGSHFQRPPRLVADGPHVASKSQIRGLPSLVLCLSSVDVRELPLIRNVDAAEAQLFQGFDEAFQVRFISEKSP
jgi:hypothetical protein